MARFSISHHPGAGPIQMDWSPLDDALRKLGDAGAEVGHQVMPVGAEILVAEVLEVFDKQGAVRGGEAWVPFWWQRYGLSRPKGRRWQGTLKLLQDSGVLVGSITPFSEALVAEAFTNVPYAGFHVSQRPRRKLPMRDFTLIDFEQAQKDFVDVILSQLDALAERR